MSDPPVTRRLIRCIKHSFFFLGLLSLLWFLFRTGTRPYRIEYPCQRASAASSCLWATTYLLPLMPSWGQNKMPAGGGRSLFLSGLLIICASALLATYLQALDAVQAATETQGDEIVLNLSERQSSTEEASDLFVVTATAGNDGGVKNLLTLMSRHGLSFYAAKSSPGLIGKDDLVIIKVNCQWDERGGTNTDLVKALVQEIVNHPDNFTGEIVIADNGQGQFGSTGHGGSLSYARNNARGIGQSMQKVADSFADHMVSTYLWDAITSRKAKEYLEGDLEDGYIVADSPNSQTGIVVTYPKFKTKYGTYVSFKLGVWDPVNMTYDREKVKILNVPVLKSHGGYGVTGCVKHYMGVVSDKLSREAGGWAHWAVGSGGMGTEMAETRFPALNILDAIWINAEPRGGPDTSYRVYTFSRDGLRMLSVWVPSYPDTRREPPYSL